MCPPHIPLTSNAGRTPVRSGSSVAGLALQGSHFEAAAVGLFVERAFGYLGALLCGQLYYVVVEALYGDASVVVVQSGNQSASMSMGLATAPPNRPECRSRSGPVTVMSR